jgi:hypothetical protein
MQHGRWGGIIIIIIVVIIIIIDQAQTECKIPINIDIFHEELRQTCIEENMGGNPLSRDVGNVFYIKVVMIMILEYKSLSHPKISFSRAQNSLIETFMSRPNPEGKPHDRIVHILVDKI